MKIAFILLLNLFTITGSEIKKVRSLYEQAASSEDSNYELLKFIDTRTEVSPLLLGYKGSATALMAKYVLSPIKKMGYFNKGTEILETAILLEPANAELRYLRFGIQTNAPSILGYNQKIDEDKLFLINSIKHMDDSSLKKSIVTFLTKSSYLSQTEKQKL